MKEDISLCYLHLRPLPVLFTSTGTALASRAVYVTGQAAAACNTVCGSPIWAVSRCQWENGRCILHIMEIRTRIVSSSQGRKYFLMFNMEETI